MLVDLMICPRCRKDGLSRSDAKVECDSCGHKIQTAGSSVILNGVSGAPGWLAKQASSVARYNGHGYNADETIPRLFGGFMAVTLDRGAAVLDIGCGIQPGLPPYVRELGLLNYAGLEPLPASVDRPFPCLSGAVAESIPLQTASLDAAIFATSQDHIADIDAAMAEVRRVVRPGGRLFMWIGLYEPEMLARAKNLELTTGSLKRKLAAPAEYMLLLWRMRDRRRRLDSGRAIDPHHERWFTRASVDEALQRWGLEASRSLVVPGAPSLFVEAVNP